MSALFEANHISVDLVRDGVAARIVDDASFSLEAGGVHDLVGPSGGGKSTLLRACALMAPLAAGSFALGGCPSGQFSPTAWRAAVCLVPQKPALVSGDVRDNLLAPWKLSIRRGETSPTGAELRDLMDEAGLGDVALSRDASQLSGGQAARVALLRAFATKPRVLLLDEVDAALDEESSAAVSALTARLAGEGIACLRIRHRASDGLACSTFMLSEGRLEHHG